MEVSPKRLCLGLPVGVVLLRPKPRQGKASRYRSWVELKLDESGAWIYIQTKILWFVEGLSFCQLTGTVCVSLRDATCCLPSISVALKIVVIAKSKQNWT